MNIAFYIDEMNYRGVANSSFQYALYNEKILKNKSIIFYNQKNFRNNNKVVLKFKKNFKVFGVANFKIIDTFQKKLKLEYIYTQKGGIKDNWFSKKIKTLVHHVYPQKLNEVHGHRYVAVSEWHSKKFSNNKIPFLPYIVEIDKSKNNLKKKLKIKKNQIVFGCHGGESSFDLKFSKDTLIDIADKRKDITFLFLNINKFCNHPRIIFLKGTSNEVFKKNFLNTCDAMIYGRSLGESFGLACGEFAIQGKQIISYKFNRHRSHINSLPKTSYEEYSSRNELFNILNKFDKKNSINLKKKNNQYFSYNSKTIMNKFNRVFLKKNLIVKFSLIDRFVNFLGFTEMNYHYIRHKIYTSYYQLFESKFFYKRLKSKKKTNTKYP